MFFHDTDRIRLHEINDRAFKNAKTLEFALEKLDKIIENQLHMSQQLADIEVIQDGMSERFSSQFDEVFSAIGICQSALTFSRDINDYATKVFPHPETNHPKKRGRPKNVG